MSRVPPYDQAAEEALIGAMLLSPDAIETAYEMVQARDFYRPAHQHIYDAVIGLWLEGQPTDPVTVADVLRRAGLLDAIGGPATLVSVQANTPSTRSAGRYAAIVAEMSQYRSLIAAASETVDSAYDMAGPPGDLIEQFGQRLVSIESDSPTDLPPDLSTLNEFLDRPAAEQAPWAIPGLLRRGWRVMVVAGEGAGKALAADTPIPTPEGWRTMGDLVPGDKVFGADGSPVTVIAGTAVMNERPCYRITFSDGEQVVADAEHRWVVVDYAGRQHGRWRPTERTTGEMAGEVRARDGHTLNYLIERTPPIQLPDVDLPLDPYLLGVWLGDGTSRHGEITTVDLPIIERIRSAGWSADTRDRLHWRIHRQPDDDRRVALARSLVAEGVSTRSAERQCDLGRGALAADGARGERQRTSSRASLGATLRRMGLIRNKHIPMSYLRASVTQREALLAGLLDADGSAQRNSVELTLCDPQLAAGAVELVRSLGYRPSAHWSNATIDGRVVGRRCRIRFTPDRPVFGLRRKQEVLAGSCHYRSVSRYVASIEAVGSVPVRCIQVDAADGIFLAGRSMVRTHNSVLLRQVAISSAAGLHPFTHRPIPSIRSLVIDLENPDEAIEAVCAPMALAAAEVEGWDPDRCWLWRRPAGIDLRRRRDRLELEQVLRIAQPDLVCLGPVYKVYRPSGKDDEETATAGAQAVLDDLRTRYRFALLLEHHAPHGADSKKRQMRPHGSVLWQRWPELGFGLEPVRDMNGSFTIGRFRGDRLPNQWPERIDRSGGRWPWDATWPAGTFDPDHPADPEPLF